MGEAANKPRNIPRCDPETKRKAAERVDVALEHIAQGVPQVEIVKILTTQHDAHWRVAYQDIEKARKRLSVACAKRATDEALGEAIAKAESHYVRCIKAGDNRAGLETLKHIAQLTGALARVEVLVQQQVNSLTIAGPTGAITAQLQGMDRGELEQFVMGRLKGNGQREVIEATADEGEN